MKRSSLFILFVLLVSNLFALSNDAAVINKKIDSIPVEQCAISALGNQNIKFGEDRVQLVFKVIDSNFQPVANIAIAVSGNDKMDHRVEQENLHTDSLGCISVWVKNLSVIGSYEVKAIIEEQNYNAKPLIYKLTVRSSNWVFMLVIGLLGGLSLFLYGMNLMSSGMQNSAGTKLRLILEKLTNNRFMAVGVGVIITTVIQSSSATNVMLVSFVNSHLMRFRQTIGIILGAAIGTTITAQIIAFKLTDYALLFVAIGMALTFISKRPRLGEVGRGILGFGILFYGMRIMSESMYPLRSFQPFVDAIVSLENPVLGILIGTLFTALIQSSSAFIGILIILSMQGLLTVNASISLIIGANIGTAITAILASINTTREAQQVAFTHTLIKVVGASLILIFLPWFTQVIDFLHLGNTDSNIASPRQIANAHTLYNVILFLLFIPFTNTLAKLVDRFYPQKEEKVSSFKLKYIEENLLSAPDIALDAARKELVRMMQVVEGMFKEIFISFITHNEDNLKSIKASEEKVNFLRDEIANYLVHLSRKDRSEEHIQETFILMNAVREFEQIADIISMQLLRKASSWCNSDSEFSDSGKEELMEYHKMTLVILKKAILVYTDFNLKKAKKLRNKYNNYREEYFVYEQEHYKRLKQENEQTISSSRTHLELITLFRVISSHAANTAHIIIYQKQEKKSLNTK